MEQRRFILFILLSTLILFGWLQLGPLLFPNAFPKPQPKGPQAAGKPGVEEPVPDAAVAAPDEPAQPVAAPAEQEWPRFPADSVVLGSMDPSTGHRMEVTLTTRGAAIESAVLNDRRYVAQNDRSRRLKVVGNDPLAEEQTLAAAVQVDRLSAPDGKSLAVVDWEIADKNESSVTFRYPWPGGTAEVLKTYTLHKGDPDLPDDDSTGYVLDVAFKFVSHADRPLPVQYVLRGPVGVPLENIENTQTFMQIKVGTVAKPGSPEVLTAKDVVEQVEAAKAGDPAALDRWYAPLQYIGVDVQYFAALVLPRDQAQDADGDGEPGYFEASEPVLVDKKLKPEHSDISVALKSREFAIPPNGSVEHAFRVYLGPKRSALLEPLLADGIISFGMFGRISVGMVWLLNKFHYLLHLPYALAIVLLTLIVRACMFPITRKQAAGAKKMKELQPKLQELKTKYAKEPEKFWQAQRDLFRKHNYHPLAGCLPLVLQLPIFIGLYSALANAVDLRMERLLWINDLTAPDALFGLPFPIPFLGSQFNLLPLITIALWIVQQKLFMPPAVSEEQEMQYKIMNYMMIVIGFMIYKVPSGLCVYFITSTVWGISERKLVDRLKPDEKKTAETPADAKADAAAPPEEPRRPGFFARLLAAADEARNQTNGRTGLGPAGDRDDDRRKGKKKRSRQR